MYNNHCKEITDYAQESSEHLFRVGLFVIATMNRHFELVGRSVESYRTLGGESPWFSRQQHRALHVWQAESIRLHKRVPFWRQMPVEYALAEVVQLPGVGIIKGAFFLQLLGCEIGCLDRHNLRYAGLDEKLFNKVPTSIEGLTRRISLYTELCRDLGGSEVLWDQWCAHLATTRPKSFASPEVVSELHVHYIVDGGE
jgi:hypothetical protein